MNIDIERADEFALAFLFLNSFRDGPVTRAWKDIPWEMMDHLHERGLISDPKKRGTRSVVMTEDGLRMAEEMFNVHLAPAE